MPKDQTPREKLLAPYTTNHIILDALDQYRDPARWVPFWWSVDDVTELCPSLTSEQALSVLLFIQRHHGNDTGINLEIVEQTANQLFPLGA